MANNTRPRLLMAALDSLVEQATSLRERAGLDLSDEDEAIQKLESFPGLEEQVGEFDEALEAALEARNNYCELREAEIEDGSIRWQKSDAQKPE